MTEAFARSGGPGSIGGPGLLESDGERTRILFRRFFRHPIQDVWAAVTDPKQVEVWGLVKVTREDTPGGRLEMEYSNGIHATGRVLEWTPPRTYEYEWNVPPGLNLPQGEDSIVRWELSTAEGGTLLVLSHRKLTRPTAQVFARGLKVFLDRLSALMDGAPLPDPPWASPAPSSSQRA
jgi:uncharacterized protein YndB with AHSA1/START domain